jgi:hypothetical protein
MALITRDNCSNELPVCGESDSSGEKDDIIEVELESNRNIIMRVTPISLTFFKNRRYSLTKLSRFLDHLPLIDTCSPSLARSE